MLMTAVVRPQAAQLAPTIGASRRQRSREVETLQRPVNARACARVEGRLIPTRRCGSQGLPWKSPRGARPTCNCESRCAQATLRERSHLALVYQTLRTATQRRVLTVSQTCKTAPNRGKRVNSHPSTARSTRELRACWLGRGYATGGSVPLRVE